MAKASLAPIYERLNSAPPYHPMSADMFADWSMEAGDIVSVSQEGTSYSSPVNSSTLTWRGSQVISVESGGNEKRGSISALSKQKYTRSGGGRSAVSMLYHEFYSEDGLLHTLITASEEGLHIEMQNLGEGLSAAIDATAESLTTKYDNEIEGLSSQVQQTARSWEARVARVVDADGNITAASIAVAINESTGEAEARIDAEKIYIGNTKSTTVINGKISASDITVDLIKAKVEAASYLAVQSLSARAFYLYDSPGETTTSVNVASTALRTAAITQSNGNYYLHLYAVDGTESVSTRDNALQLPFRGAATLSGAWSGGELTVTAGDSSIRFALFDLRPNDDISWSGNTASLTVYSNLDGGETRYATGKTLTVDASARYYAGYDANNSAFIMDYDGNQSASSVSINPGGSVELWPAYYDHNGSSHWKPSSVTVQAAEITDNRISVTIDGNQGTVTPSGERINSQNFGIPDGTYGYFQFHVTVFGHTKYYYFPFDTR